MYIQKIALIFLFAYSALSFECPKGFFCASGCGLHEFEADREARAQLAKIFNVKINSTYTTITSSMGDLDETFIHEAISEYVLQNLEGVVIKNRNQDSEGEICAHAVLNKSLFTDRIKKKIDEYIKESESIVRSGRRLALERVRVNNKNITGLSALLSVVEVDTVSKKIKIPKLKRRNIAIVIESNKEVQDYSNFLTARFNRNGLFEKKTSQDKIEGKIKLIKKPFNVSGFEKYELKILLIGIKGTKKVGSSSLSILKVGRNKEIIKEELLEELKNKIDEIFLEINI